MKLIKSNPETVQGFGSLLNHFFSDDFINWPSNGIERSFGKIPAVNIKEDQDGFHLELAVPGLKKDNFKIEFENDMITISAEVQDEKNETAENYTRKEFSYSNFRRSFRLPENTVDSNKINAKYEDGVLSISLPKKEEAKPQPAKQIEIA